MVVVNEVLDGACPYVGRSLRTRPARNEPFSLRSCQPSPWFFSSPGCHLAAGPLLAARTPSGALPRCGPPRHLVPWSAGRRTEARAVA